MAAFMRAHVCRLITFTHNMSNFNGLRNVECVRNVWLPRSLSGHCLRTCSSNTNYGNNQDREKVATHEDLELQKRTTSSLVGTSGSNIRKFVERETTEDQNIQNNSETIKKTVLTVENDFFHYKICRMIVGKGGRNLGRLILEVGDPFWIETCDTGKIVVMATGTEVVRKAAEKMQQEIQRIKSEALPPFFEKVLTDKNEVSHRQICRMIVGKGGANIKRLISETGLDFKVEVPFGLEKCDFVVVTGLDAEIVKRATEKVKQEIEIIKNGFLATISEKVFTDEDDVYHSQICGILLGKQGMNLTRILSEIGLGQNSSLKVIANNKIFNHILVCGTEAEMVNRVARKVQQEIHRIKNEDFLPFSQMVLTDEDKEIHGKICRKIIGRGGENLHRLRFETGLDFSFEIYDGYFVIRGNEAEMVVRAAEKIKLKIIEIKENRFVTFSEKLLTDEDAKIHNGICSRIIGREGENLNRLRFETGLDFFLEEYDGYFVIRGSEAEMVDRAVEKIQQEIKKIKDGSFLPFSEKVLTDEDAKIHARICRGIIGRGGENLNRLQQTGLDFYLEEYDGYFVIRGNEAEMVVRAAEKIQQEIKKLKDNRFVTFSEEPFSEKVLTDEDHKIHDRIYSMIIGRGGENLNRLRFETGLDFYLEKHDGCIVIRGSEAETVDRAVEKIQQEIQKIKDGSFLPFSEKVLTDEDAKIHARICSRIIGKGGGNINRIKMDMGFNFEMDVRQGCVIISGTDAEGVKMATEIVQQHVRRLQKEITKHFSLTRSPKN